MQSLGLERGRGTGAATAVVGQRLEGRGACLVKGVVDLVVLGAQLRIDQRSSREGEPDLVLGTALVVERKQLVEHLFSSLPRVASAIERGDTSLDSVHHQSHGEGEHLGLSREVKVRPGLDHELVGVTSNPTLVLEVVNEGDE